MHVKTRIWSVATLTALLIFTSSQMDCSRREKRKVESSKVSVKLRVTSEKWDELRKSEGDRRDLGELRKRLGASVVERAMEFAIWFPKSAFAESGLQPGYSGNAFVESDEGDGYILEFKNGRFTRIQELIAPRKNRSTRTRPTTAPPNPP